MVEISASMVMKLRKMSGQGMMDCKKALQEANGDTEQAMEILRKKGLATLSKRAGRETSEGIISTGSSEDGRTAVLASLCCETDFVAKSDDFVAAAAALADYGMACPAESGADQILKAELNGKTFDDVLTEAVSKTGENMAVGDFARFTLAGPGILGVYVHFNKKVGSMIEIETNDESTAQAEPMKRIASDIAMHVTATNPLALDKTGIDPATVEREKAIYAEQVSNKPASIIEKIVEGKMKKFYAENCLLQQPFVKDDSKTVEEVLAETAKQVGGEAKVKRFVRFAVD